MNSRRSILTVHPERFLALEVAWPFRHEAFLPFFVVTASR